jgi:integrase
VAEKRALQAVQARQKDTLEALMDTFHAARRSHLKGRSADQYESIWRRLILPDIGSTAISDIRRRQVAGLMDRIESRAGSSVADRVHEQLAIFFRWYAERDDEFTSPLVRTMKRHRKGPGARPMTDNELQRFWSACSQAGIAGAAGRFCLLTATRRDETTKAVWTEISDDGIWTIPCDRYKTAREHIVPLSTAAQALMSELEKASLYIFSMTACAPDSWTLWTTIMQVGGPSEDGLSWHSLRKTARTLMSRAGVRSDHAERALGHVQGAVERAYDKHDYLAEKRHAFDALAVQIGRIIGEESACNIVSLRAA